MFTGIVEETGRVISLEESTLTVGAGLALEGSAVGDSVAVNGACLTITAMGEGSFSVVVMPETLRRTNLGDLETGDLVDLERPLAYGGRVGGHLVQGHVDGTARVHSLTPDGNSILMALNAPADLMRHIVEKGFIALDGISLTVVTSGRTFFTVGVIPYTLRQTVLGVRRPGDSVNVEVDILAKYVERLLQGEGEAGAGGP